MIPIVTETTIAAVARAVAAACELGATPEGQAMMREAREHRAEFVAWVRRSWAEAAKKQDPLADVRRVFGGLFGAP